MMRQRDYKGKAAWMAKVGEWTTARFKREKRNLKSTQTDSRPLRVCRCGVICILAMPCAVESNLYEPKVLVRP